MLWQPVQYRSRIKRFHLADLKADKLPLSDVTWSNQVFVGLIYLTARFCGAMNGVCHISNYSISIKTSQIKEMVSQKPGSNFTTLGFMIATLFEHWFDESCPRSENTGKVNPNCFFFFIKWQDKITCTTAQCPLDQVDWKHYTMINFSDCSVA